MSTKIKTDAEHQAWDQYTAAAITAAYKSVTGHSAHDLVLKATERAAEIADALLKERQKRI